MTIHISRFAIKLAREEDEGKRESEIAFQRHRRRRPISTAAHTRVGSSWVAVAHHTTSAHVVSSDEWRTPSAQLVIRVRLTT